MKDFSLVFEEKSWKTVVFSKSQHIKSNHLTEITEITEITGFNKITEIFHINEIIGITRITK